MGRCCMPHPLHLCSTGRISIASLQLGAMRRSACPDPRRRLQVASAAQVSCFLQAHLDEAASEPLRGGPHAPARRYSCPRADRG